MAKLSKKIIYFLYLCSVICFIFLESPYTSFDDCNFEETYLSYFPLLLCFAQEYVPKEDAENVIQDVFITVGRFSSFAALIIAVAIAPMLATLDQAFQYILVYTFYELKIRN